MAYDPRLQLDMTPDGRFRTPPRTPITTRIMLWSVVVAVVAGAAIFAALALWVATALIPIVFVAIVVAVVMFRFKAWQARRSLGRQRDVQPWTTRRP